MLTTSSGKHLKDESDVHIVLLFYKLRTSARDTHDLFMVLIEIVEEDNDS